MIRRFFWKHPEWWTLAISVAAWGILVGQAGAADRGMPGGHSHLHLAAGTPSPAAALASSLLQSSLMIAAMMLPLVVVPVRAAAFRSLWRRRHQAIGGFLAGYVATWSIAYGVMLAVVRMATAGASPWRLPAAATAAVGFAIAAAWQLTPMKRSALRACHRPMPLAPRGWRAHRDCLRYGFVNAGRCITNCWALMLVPLLASHAVVVMAGVTVVCGVERYRRRPRSHAGSIAMALAGLALACATLAGGGLRLP